MTFPPAFADRIGDAASPLAGSFLSPRTIDHSLRKVFTQLAAKPRPLGRG